MQEEDMDDIQDLDAVAQAEGRRLLTMAFETGPAGDGLAGAEVLRRVRRRTSRRRRVRTLVPAGAVAALGGAAALGVTLTATVASAPSAFAAVTAAAAKTSAESFSVTWTGTLVNSPPSGAHTRIGTQTTTGVFDPRDGLGEMTTTTNWSGNGSVNRSMQVRFVGGHEYMKGPAPTHGKPWEEVQLPPGGHVWSREIAVGYSSNGPIDPGALLGLLKSAGSVQAEGPASGPGWTGTKYAFTVRLPKDIGAMASGTVYVDNQGRVRRLVTTVTSQPPIGDTETDDMTFGGFGVQVSVTAPPASQVFNSSALVNVLPL
jgi:hypothetical protein